ncbi:MAG: DUF3276 family protein [Bacteroidales bacterium]
MEEEAGIKEVINGSKEQILQEEIYTKVVRAGKRTYFFDVKATRKEDYYLTITESKKRLGKEGKIFYEKHKIFLYKEDFEKFTNGLKDTIDYICNGIAPQKRETVLSEEETVRDLADLSSREFTNIDFEDLDKK